MSDASFLDTLDLILGSFLDLGQEQSKNCSDVVSFVGHEVQGYCKRVISRYC